MKRFRYILVFILVVPVLMQSGLAQQFSKLLVQGYSSLPEDVLVAISPNGKMFRADGIKQGLSGNIDTLRIFSFDENGNEIAFADIVGFVDRGALEADNERIYLNLELNSVENNPVSLPGIGLLETGNYSHGSLLIALSHNLEVDWYEFIGTESYGSGFWECDILMLNNGNLLFNVWEDHPDYYLYVKLKEYTPEGNLVSEFWQTELVYTMLEDSQGNVYITGPCASQEAVFNGEEVTLSFSYNFFIVKYDLSHNYVWSNYVEDGTCPFTELVLNSEDELFVITPAISGEFMYDDILLNVPNNIHYAVAKLDNDGAFEWAKTITENEDGGFGGTNISFNSYAYAADSGDIFVCGIAYGNLIWNHGLQIEYLPSSPFLARLGNDGIVEWVKFGEASGTYPTATHLDVNEQGIVVGGMSKDNIGFDSIQVNQEGYFSYLAFMPFENPSTGITQLNETDFTFYPNPTAGNIHFKCLYPLNDKGFVTVSNLSGDILIQKTIDFSVEIILPTSTFSPGFYFISLHHNSGVSTKKLVIH